MKIEVTDQDIKDGADHSLRDCPVAIAINRMFDGGSAARIIPPLVVLRDGHGTQLPRTVIDAIFDFDEDGTMEPMEFDLPEWAGWSYFPGLVEHEVRKDHPPIASLG